MLFFIELLLMLVKGLTMVSAAILTNFAGKRSRWVNESRSKN